MALSSISSCFPSSVSATAIWLTAQNQMSQLFQKTLATPTSPNHPNADETPSLWNRVSNDIRKNPTLHALLVVITAYQVAAVVFSLIFGAVIFTIAKIGVLAVLFKAIRLVQQNTELKEDNDRKNALIDTINRTKETLETQFKEMSGCNATLKGQVSQLEAIKGSLESQLQELKSATESLLNSISTIDTSQALFSTTVEEGKSSLISQIERLNGAAQAFISLVQGKQDTWEEAIRTLTQYKAEIAHHLAEREASRLALAQTQGELKATASHLVAVKEDLKSHTERLGAAIDTHSERLESHSERLDSETNTLASMLGAAANTLVAAATQGSRVSQPNQKDNSSANETGGTFPLTSVVATT